jgi:Homeodomain-like domain
VPVATEASFVILFLLDVLLEWKGKPMGWLRWAPYPFAAASLWLNVYAAHGDTPGMVGHGVVTVAFFLPLLAAKAAVRRLSASDQDVRAAAERSAARRYAMDLARAQKGILWRWRVPSLLRTQIVRGRFPAAVICAVADGAQSGGAAKWEAVVERFVTDGLTQRVRMAVAVRRQERQIEASAGASPDAPASARPVRQPVPRGRVSDRERKRLKVVKLLTDNPGMLRKVVAEKAGVSESTVDRIKSEMPRHLSVAREAGG